MTPDDPRHGTLAAWNIHMKARETPCVPCATAKSRYAKRRTYDAAQGRPRSVPLWRAERRVRALQFLGWSLAQINDEAGLSKGKLRTCFYRDAKYMYAHNFKALCDAYDRLSMRHGTSTRTRNHAIAKGWLPPLAWDDIDNDPSPVGDGCTHTGCGLKVVRKGLCDKHLRAAPRTGQAWANDVDPIVVDRLLDGERVVSTRAEKDEALRRWLAAGRSERSFCQLHDLKEGRYGKGAAA